MKKLFYISSAIIPILLVGILFLAPKIHANPSGFYQTATTATTSLTFMTSGTATTTEVWDSGLSGASAQGSESAVLLVQFTASSTSAVLSMTQEFSQGVSGVNCASTPTACDWYEFTPTVLNGYATTTADLGYNVATIPQWNWRFSSSTIGSQAPTSSNNLDTRAITIQTPTRYTRIVFSVKGANGAVWKTIVAKKQNP